MAALIGSLVPIQQSPTCFLSGSSLKPNDRCFLNITPNNLSLSCRNPNIKKSLTVRASSDGGGLGATKIFLSGFMLGGLVVGALGCVYAPQISDALARSRDDREKLLRKLPKFVYDEEKILEKNRKTLEDKIAKLNEAIDTVAAKYAKGPPNEAGGYI